ncbi:MAG: NUDIX hydrolase, partial [Halocynthiibacter sp.]
MTPKIKQIWRAIMVPEDDIASRQQVAALCVRDGENGPEILLITSRGSKRWIIPKGWPMKNKSYAKAAQIEAWEEAGVIPKKLYKSNIGSYTYDKELNSGEIIPCRAFIYRIDVKKMKKNFPEKGQRKLQWL